MIFQKSIEVYFNEESWLLSPLQTSLSHYLFRLFLFPCFWNTFRHFLFEISSTISDDVLFLYLCFYLLFIFLLFLLNHFDSLLFSVCWSSFLLISHNIYWSLSSLFYYFPLLWYLFLFFFLFSYFLIILFYCFLFLFSYFFFTIFFSYGIFLKNVFYYSPSVIIRSKSNIVSILLVSRLYVLFSNPAASLINC